MPSNQQRRDAERLRLQRQLEARRERELAHRRRTLIVSIVGTLVLIAGVVTVIAVFAGSSGNHHPTPAAGSGTHFPASPTGALPSPKTPTLTPTPTPSPSPVVPPAKACAKPTKAKTATFAGVTVQGATDLKHGPKVSARSSTTPKTLECGDLVLGKGEAAKPTSTITIQYTGVLYRNGRVFDSSWSHGQPATFPVSQVVPGFAQGIAGAGPVAPMRVGGRRIMILPPALAYGSQAQGRVPANSTLVFVVDLLKVSG